MTVLIFILVLSVLVLAHEAGHYFAARIFGVKTEEFGFGFPPRLVGWVREKSGWRRVPAGERGPFEHTVWSVNALPLGGFVRLKGEAANGSDDADSFHLKPVRHRLVILAAGVLMNWALAAVLFFVVFSIGTKTVLTDVPSGARVRDAGVVIGETVPDSPAGRAAIPPGSEVVAVDGERPTSSEHAQTLIASHGTDPFTLVIRTPAEEKRIGIRAEYLPDYDKTAIGVSLADVGTVSLSPSRAVAASLNAVAGYSAAVAATLWDVFRGFITREPRGVELAGPVGIAVMSGEIARRGIIPLLQFMAILSVNLAVLNILPIPALDGGRVLFLAVEKLRGRPLSQNVEAVIHNIAFFILIGLILIITAVDIGRLGNG